MNKVISRRKALALGGAAGMLVSGTAMPSELKKLTPDTRWQEYAWSRGPDKNLVKDLKPGPTPIRLACCDEINTMMWYPDGKKSITEVVKNIRDKGYTSAGAAYGPKHNKWLDASDSEIRELKEALKKYDVTFFDMMTWDNLLHPDMAVREKNIRNVISNLEAAEKCGALSVCAGLGSLDPDWELGMNPENWTEETWKTGVAIIKRILKDTAGFKAVLGMEAVVTTCLDGPMALKSLQDDVGDPRCQIALDPANMFTVENYYHSTEMINMCFDILGESIVCCHAKDTYIEKNDMLVLMTMKPAGKGVQDYETYLTRMSHMKHPRTLLLEFAKTEEYPAAKLFIEQKAAKLGVKIYS